MSAFKLSAAAAEFRPPAQQRTLHTVPAVVDHTSENHQTSQAAATHAKDPQQAQEQQQQSTATPAAEQLQSTSAQDPQDDEYYDEYEDYDESWGYYDEEGTWVPYSVDEGWDQQQDDTVEAAAAGTSYDPSQTQQHEGPQALDADDAVALLHSCHPTHPKALLQQLVEACDGDVQQAARILSDMDYEQRKARIAAAATAGPTTTSNRSSSSIPSNASAGRKQQQFNYSLEQFPALGQPTSTITNGPCSTQRNGPGSNWAAITSKPAAAAPGAAASRPHQPNTSRHKQPAMAAAARMSPRSSSTDTAAVPWVETGAAVSQEYAAARAEAADHARVRNACFQQATLAYMSGNKALAKELSAKGKAAAEAMWAAHGRASSHIFESRNARLQQQQATAGGRAGAVIDLHGLHVQEMMQTLPQQLAALTAQQQESVSVIVGVGRHTKGPPSARMGPAAEALLKDLGYSYTQPQPGLLRVRLK